MTELKSLDTLAALLPEDPADAEIFKRLVLLASSHLPDGWRQWKAYQFTRDELLGNECDAQLLNKIRFCLPTLGMVQAFNPEADHVSEKGYRDLKVKMLNWPFCVALIIRPTKLAARVRGSAAQNELVVAATKGLKPLFISQKEASKKLSEEKSSSEEENSSSEEESSSQEGPRRSFVPTQIKKTTRLDKLEQSNNEIRAMLQSFLEKFDQSKENIDPNVPESFNAESQEDSSDYEDDHDHDPRHVVPPLLDLDLEDDTVAVNDIELDFSPHTKEQEPLIPPAKLRVMA